MTINTPTSSPTVTISTGTLRGTSANGIDRFLGVPYAAGPVGEKRFALPEPHELWTGERDATVMGATSPQSTYQGAMGDLLPSVIIPGDDYLNVNIWAPHGVTGAPVMVWIHGGALHHGSNSLDGYDGSAFARDGVVFVSVNYRLGVEGFSVLEGAPLNLGFEDVVAALRWVKAEIAAFGGDPSRVTAFGESAGAILLGSLLPMPGASDLVSQIVMESGAPATVTQQVGGNITRREARRLGVKPTRADFLGIPSSKLIDAETAVMAGGTPITGGPSYSIVVGSASVPKPSLDAVLAGAGNDIRVLMGWNRDEARLWTIPLKLKVSGPVMALVRARFKVNRRVARAYRKVARDSSNVSLFAELVVDLLLRIPFNRMADARLASGATSWLYEFAWQSPAMALGASHAMEIPFVFDDFASADWPPLTGDNPPQALADTMHAAWVRFATTGDPGWESWSSKRPVQVFDDPTTAVQYAPREEQRTSWGHP